MTTPAALTRRFIVLRALRWMPIGIVLPFIVLLPQARGLSIEAIGAIWAVHSVVILVLEVPSGALADLLGRRRVLLGGAALTSASMLAFAFAASLPAFAAAVAALAVGRALISGSLEAWYVDALRSFDSAIPLRHGLSRGTAADGIGMAFGALAGGFLPLAFSGLDDSGGGIIIYSPVALLAAAVAVAYLVAVAVLVTEPRPRRARLHAGMGAIVRTVMVNVRSSVVVRTVLVCASAFGIALTSVELLWQPRLADLLGGAEDHTVLFGLLVAGSMAGVAVGAALSPLVIGRLGARRGYFAVLLGGGAAIALLALAGSPLVLCVVYLGFYALLGLGDPVHFELLHESTTDDIRATVLSAESLAGQGGAAVGNLALAAVAGASGIGVAWAIAAGVLGLAALVALNLPRVALNESETIVAAAS